MRLAGVEVDEEQTVSESELLSEVILTLFLTTFDYLFSVKSIYR